MSNVKKFGEADLIDALDDIGYSKKQEKGTNLSDRRLCHDFSRSQGSYKRH